MDRLTDHALPIPEGKFDRCQLCGTESGDICSFNLWNECDDEDEPEPGNLLLVCRGKCRAKIDEHPRLYHLVPWGKGGPGQFILLCGDCPFRQGFGCVHPNLKTNGGEGLLVNYTQDLPMGHLSMSDGSSGFFNLNVFEACEGHPTRKPTVTENRSS